MRDRGLRQDAVTEVEDKWPIRKSLEDVVDRPIERRTAGEQHHGIEITLHRHPRLDVIPRKARIDGPVETDGINPRLLDEGQQTCADAARKSNYLCSRNGIANPADDATCGLDAPAAEFVGWQNPGPGIEHLHRIGPGFELTDKVSRGCLDQRGDQGYKGLWLTVGK